MTNMLMRNRSNKFIGRIPKILTKRSVFPFSKSRKQTVKAGFLIPIFYEEVNPGETWEINLAGVQRLLPQLAPVFDNLYVKTYFFYDPYRLLWDNFTKQHGERKNPGDSIDYITPAINLTEETNDFFNIYHYTGKVRPGINKKVVCYPARMYNHIFNEYFRDTDCQDSAYFDTSDKDDTLENYPLRKKCKMHDYFTNATRSTQAGDEAISLPLGTTANLISNGKAIQLTDGENDSSIALINSIKSYDATAPKDLIGEAVTTTNASMGIKKTLGFKESGLEVDLSNATAATISALRQAIMTQELLEADNRSGSRYTSLIEQRYGCVNPDLQLYRPMYLGGTSNPLFTNEVEQTSASQLNGSKTPLGTLGGKAIANDGNQNVIRASFGEFGAIMGLMVIQAVPQYQFGVAKQMQRWERYDYYYPEFNGLSDQAIRNEELFAQGDDILDEETGEPIDKKTWAYNGRYDDIRYQLNEICGEMHSDYPQSLDYWHYADDVTGLEEYNANFIEDQTDKILKRTLAVQVEDENGKEVDAPQALIDYQFKGVVYRGMPVRPIPKISSLF